jgi:hypothetical protein
MTNSKELISTYRILHRFINKTPKGFDTDHKDGNTYNTRKSNLRTCTRLQNGRNLGICTSNTSGYTGVTWDKHNNKWMAYIKPYNKHITLGYFDNIEDAAEARKNAEIKYYGEFSREYGNLAQ